MAERRTTIETVMINEPFFPFRKNEVFSAHKNDSGFYSRKFSLDGVGMAQVVLVDHGDYTDLPGHSISYTGKKFELKRFEKVQPDIHVLAVNFDFNKLHNMPKLECELNLGGVVLVAENSNILNEKSTLFYQWKKPGQLEGEDVYVMNYDRDFLTNLQIKFVRVP